MSRSMEGIRARRGCRIISILAVGMLLLCILGSVISAVSNLTLPSGLEETDRLSTLDKARLAESMNLKAELGEEIWSGWGKMHIPAIIWNRDYSFLTGMEDPPKDWEEVVEDSHLGEPYYRQISADPQNFAVPVNGSWAASMATKEETDLKIMDIWQEVLPPPLEQIFPYRILLQPSEVQITSVLHESFHVFQMEQARDKLENAERAYGDEDDYWAADEQMGEEWTQEIDLLARALDAGTNDEAVSLAAEFLIQREERRRLHQLDPRLIALERRYEWLEGLPKYIELEAWRQASASPEYGPLEIMADDPDFKAYQSYESRWSLEIGQMKRQASTEGATRFYYTGMAQAMLLDRLFPEWKSVAMEDSIWLEDLLREAVS
jgi:hypothetical protein